MKNKLLLLLGSLFMSLYITAQEQDLQSLSWGKVATKMPETWYGSNQAMELAKKVVSYQLEIGGWPKNIGFHKNVDEAEMTKVRTSGIGATFDNNATITEMKFLAKVYKHQPNKELRNSILRAINYILIAQYDNGGWPQFYPVRKGRSVEYSGDITFNDGAYINVMEVLREVYEDAPLFKPLQLDDSIKNKVKVAFDKGVQCILDTQIKEKGELTVWCAQHNKTTLVPSKARAYELPSYSGAESVGIVRLLMSLPNPSTDVVAAVEGAIKWFEEHQIKDFKYERFIDEKGEKNARLIPSKGSVVWARFYDLETGEPFVCDRDGIKKRSLDEIGKERKGGYSWYTTSPQQLIDAYPKWMKMNKLNNK